MPSYDVEVLVRDIKFPHESSSLYYDHLLYNSGAKRIAEPLFFAPNITKPAPLAMDGIQFISRVYHIDRFNVHNRQEAHSALERARKLINERIAVLKRRKTTKDSITYLSDLPSKWARGIRRMPHVWPSDKKNVAILFLGEPMRLPMAVKKKGGQIPPGFNLTLESLLIGGSRSFMC